MNEKHRDALLAELAAILAEGLAQDEAFLTYAASAHGVEEPEALAGLLASGDAPDLLELALYPGEALKIRLEPFLAAADCQPGQTAVLARELAGRVDRTEAVLPNGSRLVLPLSPGDLALFLERLRLEAAPPRELAAVLAERFAAGEAARLVVRLRHARLAWSRPRLFFLGLACRNLEPADPLAGETVQWALAFCDGLDPEADPVAALGARRRELTDQLKQAERLQALLESGNFETRAMQGLRLPHLHAPSLAREIDLLDRAALAATGQNGAALVREPVETDLGRYDDPAALIEMLSGRE